MGSGPSCPEPPECDCSDAAKIILDKINKDGEASYGIAQDAFREVLEENDGFKALAAALDPQGGLSTTALAAQQKWKTMQPTFQESFKNKEGMANMNVMEYIRDGVQTRHAAFRETSTFEKDCTVHGYKIIMDFLIQEEKDLNKLLNYCKTFLSDYESLFKYKSSISSIISGKNNQITELQDKIDNYKKNLFVDDRKNDYNQENYEFYKTIWFYLLIVYYSLFVIYLIFSKFIQDKLYLDKKILLFLVIYLILPIVLKFILNFIVEIFIYYLESNNIKQEVQSYADIIKNNVESTSN